jgi:hypothetical protein
MEVLQGLHSHLASLQGCDPFRGCACSR